MHEILAAIRAGKTPRAAARVAGRRAMPPRQRYVFGYGDPPEWIEEQQADGTWRIFGEGEPPSQLTLQLRRLRAGSARWMRAVGQGRALVCVPASSPSVARAKSRDLGATRCAVAGADMALRASCAGSRISFRSRKRARCTRPGHESGGVRRHRRMNRATPTPAPPHKGEGSAPSSLTSWQHSVTHAPYPVRLTASRRAGINSRSCSSCAADAPRCARPAPARSASGCARRWCPSPTRRGCRGSAPRARSPSG